MKPSTEVRIKDLGLSPRALDAITAAAPHLKSPTPTVRSVIEELTASRLRSTVGVGEATVNEIEEAMQRECGVGFVDYGKSRLTTLSDVAISALKEGHELPPKAPKAKAAKGASRKKAR